MTTLEEKFESLHVETLLPATLFSFACLLGSWRVAYLRLGHGNTLLYDAREVWKPLAHTVLSGVPLYVPPAVDNKPPLFQLVNITAGATGEYVVAMTMFVAVANGVTAVLIYRWVSIQGGARTGAVVAFAYLAALPLLNGVAINVRSFAMVGIVAAVLYTHPTLSGGSIAVAGLFSQYSVFAIPVLVYRGLRGTRRPYYWTVLFCGSGIVVVAVVFAAVWAVWGTESAIGAVYYSVGVAGDYVTGGDIHSPFYSVTAWFGVLTESMVHISWLLLPAAAGTLSALSDLESGVWNFRVFCLLIGVSLALPLFVRSLHYYWIPPLPFVGVLAVDGLRSTLSRQGSEGF